MTYREFLNTIVSANISTEISDFASAEIVKLDARNAKRRETLTPEQRENEVIKAKIVETVNATALAADVAKAFGISTQKASALLHQLVEEGKFTSGEVKIKGKGTVKAYSPVR